MIIESYLRGRVHLVDQHPAPERPASFVYPTPEHLLIQHGRHWDTSDEMSEAYRGLVRVVPQGCFDNAYRLARASRGVLRYVEGYAHRMIPVHHAWCVDPDDRVVDLTWDPIGSEYFGVVFDLDTVARARTDRNVSVLQDWPHGFPALCAPYVAPGVARC